MQEAQVKGESGTPVRWGEAYQEAGEFYCAAKQASAGKQDPACDLPTASRVVSLLGRNNCCVFSQLL